MPPEKRETGFVYQDYALFPGMSVVENVQYPLLRRGWAAEKARAEAETWLKELGLENRVNSSVEILSGGERQRVAFARAFVFRPKIWLLDEPFSALDPFLRGKARELLIDMHSRHPAPTLIVTHDEKDLERAATRTLKYQASNDGKRHRFWD